MLYYSAPMEGFTDSTFRGIHSRFFGESGAADRYYAPFVSPTFDNRLDPRKLRDLLPEQNEGVAMVPQLLCKEPAPFLWLAGELAEMGYKEINLNLGCPSGTVVAKSKGAGMLRDPAAIDRLMDGIFSATPPCAVSVKTRVGIAGPDEFEDILAVYRRYPLAELIIHPRVQQQHYRGKVAMDAFAQALVDAPWPVCYNGDLYTPADVEAFVAAYPTAHAAMLGRGLLADPALLRRVKGGSAATRAELQGYMTELYEAYIVRFGSAQNAVRRMKGYWTYLMGLFEVTPKQEKELRRTNVPQDYEQIARRLLAECPLRENAVNVWQLT